MTDKREVINPHDKILIDCEDFNAACIAVIFVGMGKYGIQKGPNDDGLPILIVCDKDKWAQKTNSMSFDEYIESIPPERVVKALRSMELVGEKTSLSDPVYRAHKLAQQIENQLKKTNHI